MKPTDEQQEWMNFWIGVTNGCALTIVALMLAGAALFIACMMWRML